MKKQTKTTPVGKDKGVGSDFTYAGWDQPKGYGPIIVSDPGDEVEHIDGVDD